MKKIKFLIFAFVALNLSVTSAFGAEKAKDSSDKLAEYKYIGVVCPDEKCFDKIQSSYLNAGCLFSIASSEVVNHERSFSEKATFRKYRLAGCMRPIPQDDVAGLAMYEKMEYKCLDGYDTKMLKTENRVQTICVEKLSEQRKRQFEKQRELRRDSPNTTVHQ